MIVSHARQFIFFHNPKCAGTSMRVALAGYHDDPFSFWGIFPAPFFRNHIDHTHLRLWEMQVLFPHIIRAAQTYRTVIFVRNRIGGFFRQLTSTSRNSNRPCSWQRCRPRIKSGLSRHSSRRS